MDCVLHSMPNYTLLQVGLPVYTAGTDVKPAEIAKQGLQEAKRQNIDVVIVDTAGRLQVCLSHLNLETLINCKKMCLVISDSHIQLIVGHSKFVD